MWDVVVLAAEELSSCFSLCALLTQPIHVRSAAALKRRIFYKESSNWLFCCVKFSATIPEAHITSLTAMSNGFAKTLQSCKDTVERRPRYAAFDSHPFFRNAVLITSSVFAWLLTVKHVWGMDRINQLEQKHPGPCLLNTPVCHWPWGRGGLGGQILFYLTFESFLGRWELLWFMSQ